jgi:hypothetical protein
MKFIVIVNIFVSNFNQKYKMEQLPADVLRLTYDYLDDHSLAQACMVNSDIAKNVCNSKLWIPKIQNKFGFNKDEIDEYKGNNTYWGYYLNLSDITDNKNPTDLLKYGIENNRMDLVIVAYNRGAEGPVEIYYPLKYKNNAMLELLLTNNPTTYKSIDTPIGNNNIVGLDILLKYNPDIKEDHIILAIKTGIRYKDGTILYKLLAHSPNKFPNILLYVIKKLNIYYIIAPFLYAGLDPNALNGEIFYTAVQRVKNPKILELFLEKGADVHLNNDAVLKYVSEWGRPETVKVFEKYLIEGGYSTKRLNLNSIQQKFQSLRDDTYEFFNDEFYDFI